MSGAETAVVAGGTGAVGTGIVRALLRAGSRVVVPTRSAARLDGLRRELDAGRSGLTARLVGVVGDLSDPEDGLRVAEHVADQVGPVDRVVASIGGWWQGPSLVDTDPHDFDRVMAMGLRAHYLCARALVPRLRTGGTYLMINGFSAETPYPGAAAVSVSAAAQLMLTRNLAAELAGQAHVGALVLGPVVTAARPTGGADWITADDVGEVCLRLPLPGSAPGQITRIDTTRDLEGVLAGGS